MKTPFVTTSILASMMLTAGMAAAQQQPYPPPPSQQQQPYPPPQQPYGVQPPPQPYGAPQQPYGGALPPQGYAPPPQQPYAAPGYPPAQPPPPPAPYAPQAVPAVGSAAPFGASGQVILSAGRLFGVSAYSAKVEGDNNVSITESGTAINLLYGTDAGVAGPYSAPRLGFDYIVAPNVSLGGELGFVSRSGTYETKAASTTSSRDLPKLTGFAFSPRFGYIVGINPTLAIWLRAGVTYWSLSSEAKEDSGTQTRTTTTTASNFALNVDPQLVISPTSHFAVTLAPVLDLPLSGNLKIEQSGATSSSQENTYKITNFGIQAGLLGYF